MTNTMLKEAANDQLVFAKKTLSLITSGEIGVNKAIKPLEVTMQQISDAQDFIQKISNEATIPFKGKIQIEGIIIKIEALISAVMVLDEEDESTLQLDILNKISDTISEKLKPAILN